jgi:hypothetical protein
VEKLNDAKSFCTNCGDVLGNSVAFCASCGFQIAVVANKPLDDKTRSSTGTGVLSRWNSLNPKLRWSSLVAVALVISLLFVMPRGVDIVVSIDDRFGGVFTSNCELTASGLREAPQILRFGSETTSPEIAIDYRKIDGECAGLAQASLLPFQTYEAFSDGSNLGTVLPSDVSAGRVEVSARVEIYNEISGTFDISDNADRCSAGYKTCWWPYYFGIKFPRTSETDCAGDNGYSDIRRGTVVKIIGNSNGITTSTSLGYGTEIWPSSRNLKTTCSFELLTVKVPNDDMGYSIEASNRGQVVYTLDELENQDWSVDLVLGN